MDLIQLASLSSKKTKPFKTPQIAISWHGSDASASARALVRPSAEPSVINDALMRRAPADLAKTTAPGVKSRLLRPLLDCHSIVVTSTSTLKRMPCQDQQHQTTSTLRATKASYLRAGAAEEDMIGCRTPSMVNGPHPAACVALIENKQIYSKNPQIAI